MRNIPMFVTENGAASLTLDQIPYQKAAYIQLLDSMEPEALLQECCDFCRSAGAEAVYAWGHSVVEVYPVYTSVLLYEGKRENLPDTEFVAEKVAEEHLSDWVRIYNENMNSVAGAAYMTIQKARECLEKGTAYEVLDPDGDRCGIGVVDEDSIQAVISLYRGMGGDILAALAKMLPTDRILLEVASSNERAVRLYNNLGLHCIEVLSDIHKIF